MIRPPPRSTLFPTTPLSRSVADRPHHVPHPGGGPHAGGVGQRQRVDASVHEPLGHLEHPAGLDVPLEPVPERGRDGDRKSTRLNSSHSQISYAVFCLKKKKQ